MFWKYAINILHHLYQNIYKQREAGKLNFMYKIKNIKCGCVQERLLDKLAIFILPIFYKNRNFSQAHRYQAKNHNLGTLITRYDRGIIFWPLKCEKKQSMLFQIYALTRKGICFFFSFPIASLLDCGYYGRSWNSHLGV